MRPSVVTLIVLGASVGGCAGGRAPGRDREVRFPAATPSPDRAGHRDYPASSDYAGYPYWPDLGGGRYRNPVVLADYSDPDPIRVDGDYYLVASSFNCTPGLPILHSRDLVNWRIAGHALQNVPGARFDRPQPGQGVWAPSIRAHAGGYVIAFPLYCKPADGGACAEEGIWVVTAPHPTGPWSEPRQLLAARGVIDPALFWDDDGRAYLVHAYAKSRAGFNGQLDVRPMAPDTTRMLGAGQMVFGDASSPIHHPTLEGPKMYKRNGWYYILAPAGGVAHGWQVALRSRGVYGPYEDRVILQQGSSAINGPHQGGLVDTPDGSQWWFLHFQDAGIQGRILHLNPVTWVDDWPMLGAAAPGDQLRVIRQPVDTWVKPALPSQPVQIPQTTDEFSETRLGPQWQWQANHQDSWLSLSARRGALRLFPQQVPGGDLAQAANLLMQKIPARSFTVETALELTGTQGRSRAGLVLWGDPAMEIAVTETTNPPGVRITLTSEGRILSSDVVAHDGSLTTRLGVSLAADATVRFFYGSATGPTRWFPQSLAIAQRKNSWIGVKVGLYAAGLGDSDPAPPGHADVDYFRFSHYAAPG